MGGRFNILWLVFDRFGRLSYQRGGNRGFKRSNKSPILSRLWSRRIRLQKSVWQKHIIYSFDHFYFYFCFSLKTDFSAKLYLLGKSTWQRIPCLLHPPSPQSSNCSFLSWTKMYLSVITPASPFCLPEAPKQEGLMIKRGSQSQEKVVL